MSGILLAAAMTYDIVTRECHATAQVKDGAPVMVCQDRIWVVGLSRADCRDSLKRIKAQVRGEVAETLDFKCVPEDDE